MTGLEELLLDCSWLSLLWMTGLDDDEDLAVVEDPLLDPSWLSLLWMTIFDDDDLTVLEEVEDLAFLLLLDPSWLSPLWMTIFDDDEDLTVVEELLKSSGAGDEPLSSPQATRNNAKINAFVKCIDLIFPLKNRLNIIDHSVYCFSTITQRTEKPFVFNSLYCLSGPLSRELDKRP